MEHGGDHDALHECENRPVTIDTGTVTMPARDGHGRASSPVSVEAVESLTVTSSLSMRVRGERIDRNARCPLCHDRPMPTRIDTLAIDAADPARLARFWAAALDYAVTFDEPDEVAIEPRPGSPGLPLLFLQVPEPKTRQNRVHLDLGSAVDVARLTELGAHAIDVGQGDVPWTVLADPEGNELCVLEPRPEYEGLMLAAIVFPADDPGALARFWVAATGWELADEQTGIARLRAPGGQGPWLEFVAPAPPKTVKNRLHLDVAPFAGDDQAAEVERLRTLGAAEADVGQGEQTWVVLADPEGNEFCVLTPR
jgi:hypothetical protein